MMKLNKKGFTLVELLAVIVILALLMVVGTRAIGGSLASSKQNAMKTEAQKILSKTYEDIQTAILMGTVSESSFTYGVSGGYTAPTTSADGKVKLKDADYNIVLTIEKGSSYKITELCIDDGKNKYADKTVTNGNSVAFDEEEAYTAITASSPACS